MNIALESKTFRKNKPNLWLCLPYPRRDKINKLPSAYNIKFKLLEGKVHELSFDMPFELTTDEGIIKNPLIDQLDAYYQVYMEWNGIKEYFVYTVGNRKLDNSGKVLSYRLYSSAYMIGKKIIREYSEESRTLSYHANILLQDTNWKLGYVDPDFELKYRTLELSQTNRLQAIIDLAVKFGALLEFDNTNYTVSFVNPLSTGRNKQFTFKTGISIESLGQEINYDELVTRLIVTGADGLDFRTLSPTGSNFIEDLTWFTYPFEYDKSNGDINVNNYATYRFNITRHSKFMTDELVTAYIRYQTKLKALDPTFKSLVEQRGQLEDDIVQEQKNLSDLESELKVIENELFVVNKTKQDMIEENELSQIQNGTNKYDPSRIVEYERMRVEIVARYDAKLAQVNAKNNDIKNINNRLENTNSQIANLREQIKIENNFTEREIIEYNEFVHQQVYNNDSIVNVEDLLDDGIRAFKSVNVPPVSISLDVSNFIKSIDFEEIRDRIALGDEVKVKSEELDVFVSLKIIELAYDLNTEKVTLTIANVKEINNDQNKLLNKIYSSANTSATVDLERYKWNKGDEALTGLNQLLQNGWDAAQNALFGGYQNTTVLDSYGLKSTQFDDPDTFLFINNGVLGITRDGGRSFEVAITKDGVHAGRIVGKLFVGERMVMEDSNGVWETHGSTTVIYDRNRRPSMWIGQVDPNCFGIRMDNARHRINLTTCDGFKISKYNGSSLEDVMYIDLDGNIWSKYWTHDTTKIKDSQGYFGLDDNKIVIKDGNQEVMRMGLIPSMYFNGCYINTDWGVVLKGQNNSNIFMTRNRGFAIDVGCTNKFSVNSQGNIFAQDIEANNLMIKSAKIGNSITINESSGITINGNTATVKMNAIDGFKISVSGQDVFYVGSDGKLYARNFYTLDANGGTIPDDVSGSFISDLTVNRLKTLTQSNRNDYIHIENTYIRFMSQGLTKLQMTYSGSGFSAYPIMIWGAGAGGGTSTGYTYKTNDRFVHEYFGTDGRRRAIEMTDMSNRGVVVTTPYGLTIDTDAGSIEISPTGISFNGAIVYPF